MATIIPQIIPIEYKIKNVHFWVFDISNSDSLNVKYNRNNKTPTTHASAQKYNAKNKVHKYLYAASSSARHNGAAMTLLILAVILVMHIMTNNVLMMT